MSQDKIQAALEQAINGMVGLVPASNIVSSAPGSATVFTTDAPHGLLTGVNVTVSGHGVVDGDYTFEVVDDTRFKLRDQASGSYVSTSVQILGGQVQANLTEWENTSFSPVVGVPYQRVHVRFATPETPEMGSNLVRESGFAQITLHYPLQVGTGDIRARVDLIKEVFKKNTTVSFGGVNVIVTNSPERIGGEPLEQSYAMGVRIPFRCDIYS